MKTNNKTTKAIRTIGAGLLAAAMGTALPLSGCAGGGAGTTSTATWPSATPPPTSETNTYLGTQSPGLYTVIIDHTNNTFSYQDLSVTSAAVSGTFTTTANGFLSLSTGGYALEQLSRAVMVIPPPAYGVGQVRLLTSAPIFAVTATSCQVIPSKTEFEYLAPANPNYGLLDQTSAEVTEERAISSGQVYAATDTSGADWQFGGEVQYEPPTSTSSALASYVPLPDPFSATCATDSAGTSLVQTTLTVPTSIPASFVIGPTGFFIEDRYQSDGVAFVGAVRPQSPVDLSQLSGATFLGVHASGTGTSGVPSIGPPALVSLSAAMDSSGTSIKLTGGAFPNNDPAQVPATATTFDLGAQDPINNGYFPSASVSTCNQTNGMCNGTYTTTPEYALVSNAGEKYTIFISPAGWILFQQ